MKKKKGKYFSNLDISKFTDNKKFWNTDDDGVSQIITMVNDGKIISDDKALAETFK